METLHNDLEAIESVVPGIISAYESLLAKNGMGIYTSSGAFYNHTLFGRDATMSAKFVSDFDHETTKQTIVALAALQGTRTDRKTQEEPGRIHHEFRDFHDWKGRFGESLVMHFYAKLWGSKHGVLQTYFAADTTANYIRLVNKFCHHIDPSFLDHAVRVPEGKTTVAETIERAADWIVDQLDTDGRFMTVRSKWSLPYQTFQDSVTAYSWADTKAMNYRKPHSFVEVQAYGADALLDASMLLSGRTAKTKLYEIKADEMRRALFAEYWSERDNFFTSALSVRDGALRPLDVPNISAGWTLNTAWWDDAPEKERKQKISAIVERLFSDEFLTDVGIRTRSINYTEPLGDTVDYHGSQTVWPMFNFMVIEGLRRHRMYVLAEQLERRLVNGINAVHEFTEFFIVDKEGHLCRPEARRAHPHMRAQMVPERDIAFTIVPLISIARRTGAVPEREPKKWHSQLEDEILSRINLVPLLAPTEAEAYLQPERVFLTQAGASLRSLIHAYGKVAS